jgi:tetratricopeptide (TPR) repeat protein
VIDPGNALAYNNRGKAHQLAGDHSRALEDYNEAIRIDPGFAFAYANRGLLRLIEGNAASAERDFERSLVLNPDMKASLDLLIAEIRAGKD